MVSYSDIQEIEIKNPKVYLGFFLGGCFLIIWKLFATILT